MTFSGRLHCSQKYILYESGSELEKSFCNPKCFEARANPNIKYTWGTVFHLAAPSQNACGGLLHGKSTLKNLVLHKIDTNTINSNSNNKHLQFLIFSHDPVHWSHYSLFTAQTIIQTT